MHPFGSMQRVPSLTIAHVSASPPLIPDGRVSRVRLAVMAFPSASSRCRRSLSTRMHAPRSTPVIAPARLPGTPSFPGSVSGRGVVWKSAMYRGSLCRGTGVTRPRVACATSAGVSRPSTLLWTHAPYQEPLAAFRLSPMRRVFAGCCEPLLVPGPSRRYLRSLCGGAWTRTPPRSTGAHTRFFPADIGLTSLLTRSAHGISLQSSFHRGSLSGLQSFANVQAPPLVRPPGCSHRRAGFLPVTGRPGRLHHAMCTGLPP
jgi:hypothetical protein